MKNKKIYLPIIIVFIILSILSFGLVKRISYAENDTILSEKALTTFAHKGYDELITYTLEGLCNYKFYEIIRNNVEDRQYCTQTMCVEMQAKNDWKIYHYPYAIIDINKDGKNPRVGEITYFVSENGKTVIKTKKINSYFMPELAYIAQNAQMYHVNCTDHTTTNHNRSWYYKNAYINIIGNRDGAKYLNGLVEGLDLTVTNDRKDANDKNREAIAYRESVDNGTYEKTYSARIIIFKGGEQQSSAILSGKINDVIPSKPEINKYISDVKLPDEIEYTVNLTDRSQYTEEQKISNPVIVPPGSIITYTISVGGEQGTDNATFTVKDTFDKNNDNVLTYYSGELSKTVKIGDSYQVQLKVNDNAPMSLGTKYQNRAKIEGYDKLFSDDYIKVYAESPKPEINKYISGVTLPDGTVLDVGDRSNYSEEQKKSNPVNILPGSTVTYTISIGGDSGNYPNKTFTVNDNFDNVLTYVSGDLSKIVKIGDSYQVQLKVSDNVSSSSRTKYKNRVEIDSWNRFSDDYIKVEYEIVTEPEIHTTSGNYKKYIIKHNGNNVSGRTEYNNITAKENPLTVNQGDIVTYRLEVTNTSAYDIKNLKVKDILGEGLTYNGRGGTHDITIGNIGMRQTAFVDIEVKVTKSNMHLLPIENKFEIIGGTYTDIEIIGTYIEYNGTRILISTEENSVEKPINTSWFSSNSNADYVQLDDPEIAGDVWIDLDKDGLKDRIEQNLSGITVELYKNGTYVDTKTTDNFGHYSFGKVAKGNVPYSGGTRKYADNSGYNSYYVMFKYNGVKYEDTVFTGTSGVTDTGTINNWNSKSHAEEEDRDGFNKSLETIAYNRAYAGTNGTETSEVLEYTKSGHTSTLKSTNGAIISAKSVELFIDVDGGDTVKADHTEYLKHINLGLVQREQGDLSLKKDVISATVTINGYTSTYNYGKYGTGDYTGTYKLKTPYKLGIYKGDYDFRASEYPDGFKSASDELQITIKYRVTLKNDSIFYTSVIREVIDTSSASLTLKSTSVGEVKTTSVYNSGVNFNYSGYQTHFINMNTTLAPNASTTFDLEYTVNKDANGIIMGEKANIAQIGAYSMYLNNKPAGVVDRDSNPGIVNPGVIPNISTDTLYEDHSYYTCIVIEGVPIPGDNPPGGDPPGENPPGGNPPGGIIQRKITGNVWEDLNTAPATEIGQKTGNGKKDSGESGAQNVTVLLLEVVKHNGEEYLIDTGLTTETDANGDYTLMSLSGKDRLHAGEYVVRFVYGDEASEFTTETGDTIRYSGQDYKSTTYTPVGNLEDETEIVDVTEFEKLRRENGHVSVARDDEIRRLEVIDYSSQMTYRLDNILKAHDNDVVKEELAKNTSMFADTKMFNVQIEKTNALGVEKIDNRNENVNELAAYTYTIGELNFGLIERPITKLELMDDIKEITAVTSSGKEILHIYFDIEYKYNSETNRVDREIKLNRTKSAGEENVQMLDRTNSTKGFRYVNIDSELLQGMNVNIKYQFAIANIGDIDTSNENLINMVKDYKVEDVTNKLNTTMITTQYKLGSGSGINEKLLKNTTYKNTENAVKGFKSSYNQYKTFINGSTNDKDYELGYFLGNKYYNLYNASTDKIVETRVDQIVSYVDNDLIFTPEDNASPTGSAKFQTYTMEEIEKYALLKGVTAENASALLVDNVGVSYITETKNNLAFNVEDAKVNESLYKYLKPIKSGNVINEEDLYMTQLNASRILASELDVEDVVLDNLTEIVKISNTVGRKAYIEFMDTQTGSVITPGPSGPTGYLGNTPDFLSNPDEHTVGQKEVDTNFTETVTFSPPTGLSNKQHNARAISTTVIVILIGIVILGVGAFIVYMLGRKKFYK